MKEYIIKIEQGDLSEHLPEYILRGGKVEELIRCRDCCYTDESLDRDFDYWCTKNGCYVNSDGFCSNAERRGE